LQFAEPGIPVVDDAKERLAGLRDKGGEWGRGSLTSGSMMSKPVGKAAHGNRRRQGWKFSVKIKSWLNKQKGV